MIDLPLPDKEDIVAKVSYHVDYSETTSVSGQEAAEMSEREIEELVTHVRDLRSFRWRTPC